jgi:hypothetical protein
MLSMGKLASDVPDWMFGQLFYYVVFIAKIISPTFIDCTCTAAIEAISAGQT